MNTTELIESTTVVLGILDEYAGRIPRNERELDVVLYAYLKGRFAYMTRQHHVHMYGSRRPQRIDFRHGGTNSAVIEFAVRPAIGGAQLHGSSNASELRKLARVTRDGVDLILTLRRVEFRDRAAC